MKTAIAAAEPDEPRRGFHSRDGWYFRRREDGAVEVSCTTGAVALDASTWASAVASVSAAGETANTYRAALAFHDSDGTDDPQPSKTNWIDAPTFLLLNQACLILCEAFGGVPYLVGSALHRRDFRDVDVRLILDDERYAELFPGVERVRGLTHARWSVLCSSISLYLRHATGLPVDFQFQSVTDANRYPGPRHPLGIFPTA